MKKTSILAAAALLIALATGPVLAGDYGHDAAPAKDIVDTAVAAGTFETLVAAVKAAGLVDTLKGDGPFTVFAPNDEAFAKLPAGTVEGLLEKPEELAAILKFHVVAGKNIASDVAAASSFETVQGQSLTVDTTDGVKIGGAKVLTTDVLTSNGVIHIIDTVLIPQS